MKLKIIIGLIIVVVVIVIGAVFFLFSEKGAVKDIQSFEDCAANGFPVQESYPRRCITPDGRSFVEPVEILPPKHDLISVAEPIAGATIASPVTIKGRARGYWFFEASFPVELQDAAGNVLARGIAQADGDWMTEEFVPFMATLDFQNSEVKEGKLILRKDNPSGLPENEDQLIWPVVIGVSN